MAILKPKDLLGQFVPAQDPIAQFVRLAREHESLWASHGFRCRAFHGAAPALFAAANDAMRHRALWYLNFNVQVLREMTAQGESPRSTQHFLWRALKKLDLVPPSDLMGYIEGHEDIVEIYLLDEIQVFRSALLRGHLVHRRRAALPPLAPADRTVAKSHPRDGGQDRRVQTRLHPKACALGHPRA